MHVIVIILKNKFILKQNSCKLNLIVATQNVHLKNAILFDDFRRVYIIEDA